MLTALQFQTFDGEFVRRLINGDTAAGDHFASYFGNVLQLKLRVRLRAAHMVDDVLQATLLRVLQILQKEDGLRHPERLGAFVNAVCDKVLLEHYRSELRYEPWDHTEDPVDASIDLDAGLTHEDMKAVIFEVMQDLSKKDRVILEKLFLEEMDKRLICEKLGIDAGYLRVLKHRARKRFRQVCNERGYRH